MIAVYLPSDKRGIVNNSHLMFLTPSGLDSLCTKVFDLRGTLICSEIQNTGSLFRLIIFLSLELKI